MSRANHQVWRPTSLLGIARWSAGLDLGLWTVVLVATATRLAFALRPPPFLTPDSQGYFLPGWELAHGIGFGPELRRTPVYPLFIGLVVFLLGEDLRALTFAQHAVGVATAGLSYVLGRVAFGRVAGLLAGLAAGLSGPLLIYEHYVATEPLFTCLLVLAVLLALLALRRPTRGRLLAAGLGLAASILTRPVAEVLLPLVPLALLIRDRARWTALRRTAWFGLGLAILILPWMTRNALIHGTFAAEGALGQALMGRTVRHDDYRQFYACPPEGTADSPAGPSDGALRIICEEAMSGEPSGGTITTRLRDELGLSQAEASSLLRQVALQAISRRPDYYLAGSLKMAGEILVGKRETVIAAWRERTTRNWDNKWDPRLTPLVKNPPAAEGPDYERADALVSLFQPFRWRYQLALLLGLGVLAAATRQVWRAALILPLAAGAIVLASAALDGNVWRYRYPVDPLLAVMAGGGAQAVWSAGSWVIWRAAQVRAATGRRRAEKEDRLPAEPTPAVERG